MRKSLALTIAIFWLFSLQSQVQHPANNSLFAQDEVTRYDITIDPVILNVIYGNVWSNIEHPATVVISNSILQDTLENIGFRLRGNTSRFAQKKSFKISINSFEPGKKFLGLEKINLNGHQNDPSMARAFISWNMAQDFGLPSSRVSFADVYINGVYYGLYTHVEHIDEEFTKSRYGNNYGNLYKCTWGADLDWWGSDPQTYINSGVYELKSDVQDYSDLVNFLDVLNNTPSADLECELEAIFNVQDYLKVMAFDVATGNWDGPLYNKNNFYLYNNPVSGRIEYFPYDLDNTLGVDWLNQDWSVRNIYNWSPSGEPRPLYTRLMGIQAYRNQFSFHLNNFLQEIMHPDSTADWVIDIRDELRPSAIQDVFRTYDFGFTLTDFDSSFTQAQGGHIDQGIQEYIHLRRSTALGQLNLVNMVPIVNHIQHNQALNQTVYFKVQVQDEGPSTVELVLYNGNFEIARHPMLDDGLSGDGLAGDEIYGVAVSSIDPGVTGYKIEAYDQQGNITRNPCDQVPLDDITTGLSDLANETLLQLAPNPAINFLKATVDFPIKRIEMYDLQGRVVSNQESDANEFTIGLDITSLPAGKYFIKIFGTDEQIPVSGSFIVSP